MGCYRLARFNTDGGIQVKWKLGHIKPFWNDEYTKLKYTKKPFNNYKDLYKWREQGYTQPEELFVGMMCAFGEKQPKWTDKFVKWAETEFNLKDIGCCFYRMETGVILPKHRDTYKMYAERFNCRPESVHRILVFLEDWKSGHYFELEGKPMLEWKAGNYASWNGRTEHFAANIGVENRYTLQITGHRK